MLGMPTGILLDDGLNLAVKMGSITRTLAHGDLYAPVGGRVGCAIGGTFFGVLACFLWRCVHGFALRVGGAVGLVDVVMVGDGFTL